MIANLSYSTYVVVACSKSTVGHPLASLLPALLLLFSGKSPFVFIGGSLGAFRLYRSNAWFVLSYSQEGGFPRFDSWWPFVLPQLSRGLQWPTAAGVYPYFSLGQPIWNLLVRLV